jgi:cell wall-associated NlpC family hydrolase
MSKLEAYTQKDMEHWEFNDYIDLSQGGYKIDSSIIRTRIIFQAKNSWKAYEDSYLVDYCNGERISTGIEVPWAETDEQKKMVVNNFFIQMRRKLRRITIATIGNSTMDTGDLAKLKLLTSTANRKYMIVGIRSSFSSSGYIDLVDLEFVTSDGDIAVEAEGNYATNEENTDIPLAYSKRDLIIDEAKRWLGTYYQWGGNVAFNKNHYGLDCSHFTYTVYNKFELMDSYKTAAGQYGWIDKITKEQLQKGDLVFYTNSSGRVGHVGIYMGDNKIISASGGDSSTTTQAKARQRNVKVKIHPLNYRSGPYYYGTPSGL